LNLLLIHFQSMRYKSFRPFFHDHNFTYVPVIFWVNICLLCYRCKLMAGDSGFVGSLCRPSVKCPLWSVHAFCLLQLSWSHMEFILLFATRWQAWFPSRKKDTGL
jgi:hypothetical protein